MRLCRGSVHVGKSTTMKTGSSGNLKSWSDLVIALIWNLCGCSKSESGMERDRKGLNDNTNTFFCFDMNG